MKRGERKEVCKRGHSLIDPDNVRFNKRGAAVCRACVRLAARRTTEATADAPVRDARWTDDELGVAADSSLTAMQAAKILGRTVGAVTTMRLRLRRGWEPNSETPLTDDELDFIRVHPEMTALRVAEELDRPYPMITKARRGLIAEEGLTFGGGPYDKSPHMVGKRLLLARTCVRCGVIRGGAEFPKAGEKIQGSTCRYCRAELRDDRSDRTSLDDRVRELAEVVGIPYMSRHYDEYATPDLEVMARDNLTLCEKAAHLGRTYQATAQAMKDYGVTAKRPERREPRGVWTIEPARA